jgi:CRP/FNR family transcriptional regulator, cyclic AMP receptor protein
VAEWLCQRVTEVEHVLAETVFNSVRSRIASALLRLHQRAPEGKRNIGITHQEIANLVGSTRETTTALLHAFKKEGILEIGNRRITILDAVQLERAARSG